MLKYHAARGAETSVPAQRSITHGAERHHTQRDMVLVEKRVRAESKINISFLSVHYCKQNLLSFTNMIDV